MTFSGYNTLCFVSGKYKRYCLELFTTSHEVFETCFQLKIKKRKRRGIMFVTLRLLGSRPNNHLHCGSSIETFNFSDVHKSMNEYMQTLHTIPWRSDFHEGQKNKVYYLSILFIHLYYFYFMNLPEFRSRRLCINSATVLTSRRVAENDLLPSCLETRCS